MKFTIEIESNDDAFVEDPKGEVFRLLKLVSENIYCGAVSRVLHDINGHRCGQWSMTEETPTCYKCGQPLVEDDVTGNLNCEGCMGDTEKWCS